MHSHEGVHDVEEVRDVVQDHPGHGDEVVELPEHGPPHHHDKIVQDSHVNNPQPLTTKTKLFKNVWNRKSSAHVVVICLPRVNG